MLKVKITEERVKKIVNDVLLYQFGIHNAKKWDVEEVKALADGTLSITVIKYISAMRYRRVKLKLSTIDELLDLRDNWLLTHE